MIILLSHVDRGIPSSSSSYCTFVVKIKKKFEHTRSNLFLFLHAMNTVSLFNKTLKNFLVDLKKWAPNDPVVKWARKTYMTTKRSDPMGPHRAWTEFAKKHPNFRDVIEARDLTWVEANSDVARLSSAALTNGGSVAASLRALQADQQEEFWRYVGSLTLLADTLNVVSEESMTTIQHFAEQCARDLMTTTGASTDENDQSRTATSGGGDDDRVVDDDAMLMVRATTTNSSVADTIRGDGATSVGSSMMMDDAQMAQMIQKTTEMMPKMLEQMGMNVSSEEMEGAARRIQSGPMMGIISTLMRQQMM